MPTLPFTHEQFISVFARYNEAIWPVQVLAYVLGGWVVFALLRRPPPWRSAAVLGALALMWAWTGVGYHWMSFAAINPAAIAFGAAFVLQAVLLLVAAARRRIEVGARRGPAAAAGWGLIAYALVLYPLLGVLAGQRYPGTPVFGITPCPVTLFTFGVLLLSRGTPGWLLVVPVAWSLIGGSAAVLLQVPQDWVLLASFLAVIPIVLGKRQARSRGEKPA